MSRNTKSERFIVGLHFSCRAPPRQGAENAPVTPGKSSDLFAANTLTGFSFDRPVWSLLSVSLNASGLIAVVARKSFERDAQQLNHSEPNGIPIRFFQPSAFWSGLCRAVAPSSDSRSHSLMTFSMEAWRQCRGRCTRGIYSADLTDA